VAASHPLDTDVIRLALRFHNIEPEIELVEPPNAPHHLQAEAGESRVASNAA